MFELKNNGGMTVEGISIVLGGREYEICAYSSLPAIETICKIAKGIANKNVKYSFTSKEDGVAYVLHVADGKLVLKKYSVSSLRSGDVPDEEYLDRLLGDVVYSENMEIADFAAQLVQDVPVENAVQYAWKQYNTCIDDKEQPVWRIQRYKDRAVKDEALLMNAYNIFCA